MPHDAGAFRRDTREIGCAARILMRFEDAGITEVLSRRGWKGRGRGCEKALSTNAYRCPREQGAYSHTRNDAKRRAVELLISSEIEWDSPKNRPQKEAIEGVRIE